MPEEMANYSLYSLLMKIKRRAALMPIDRWSAKRFSAGIHVSLKKIFAKHRLTRADLISEIKGHWGLVEDHQRRCDYVTIHQLVKALDSFPEKKPRNQLVEIIQYDSEIHKLGVARAGLKADKLDFLFGRPLTITIKYPTAPVH